MSSLDSNDTLLQNPLIKQLQGVSGTVSSLTLFGLMALTCVDVVGRYFFNAPLDGATELTQIMLGILVFAILPLVSLHEEHVSVDLVDLWYPKQWVRPRQLLLNGLMAVLMAVVAWRVWIIADFMAEYGDATEFLAIPYAPITYFIAIMSGLAGGAFACNVVRYWHRTEVGSESSPAESDTY